MAEVATHPSVAAISPSESRSASATNRPRGVFSLLPLLPGVLLGLAALALRLHEIGHESLWLDEGYTLLFSGLPFDRLITVGGAHEHPPLYYSIVHAILQIHTSYLVPRVISAVTGSLAVLALYALGRQVSGIAAGSTAALLLVVNPFHVWYGQDGRGYELAGLMVVMSYLFLFRALDRPRRITWALYGLCLALCLYSEYTTLFAIVPQILLVLRARSRGLVRPMLLAWLGAGLLFVPWMGVASIDAAGIAVDYWIPTPTLSTVANTLLEFVGFVTPCASPPCSGTEIGLPGLVGHAELSAGVIAILGLAALLWSLVRRDITSGTLSLWLILPFILVLLIATRRSLYLDRIFLDATFPLYLLLGLGIAQGLRRPGYSVPATLAAALMVGASAANLGPIYAGGINPDWKSAARDLGNAYRPGQAVIFNPGVLRTLLDAYLPVGWHATYERPLWSSTYLDVPGWQNRYSVGIGASKHERMQEETRLRNVQFAAAARGRRQLWLVTYDYPGMNDSRRWFTDHGFQNILSEMYEGSTRIELWDRAAPTAFGSAVVPDSGFDAWHFTGSVRVASGVAIANGLTVLDRSFPVSAGRAYSTSVHYLGLPPASKPTVKVDVYDRSLRRIATFPRTQWYDWPVNGVWLSQPFGFVAPPGAVSATITLSTQWGESFWRHVAVYLEPRA